MAGLIRSGRRFFRRDTTRCSGTEFCLRPLIPRSFEPQASDRRLTLRGISFQRPTRRSGVSWEEAA